ncbi:MAG: hypothetical protein BroJett040_05500 [Oligoflexia bacterium]|nr:MAG: hypothetical protein BroJett040_05500 [Oligoflexia bacterium]
MDKAIERWNWVRDLVNAEEKMEETGMVDMSVGYDNERYLVAESLNFLQQMKNEFIEASNAFNDLKHSPMGRIKIYGIAKTQADFMLFRNGFKMIFSLKSPGVISIRFNFLGPSQYMPSQIPTINSSAASSLMEEHLVEAKRGPFADLKWTFKGEPVSLQAAVKYHMTLFIKESAK